MKKNFYEKKNIVLFKKKYHSKIIPKEKNQAMTRFDKKQIFSTQISSCTNH